MTQYCLAKTVWPGWEQTPGKATKWMGL